MYETRFMKLKEVAVFSLADVSQIVSGKAYAKKLLKRMIGAGEIKRIMRDIYTFHDDPLLISSFLIKPSYVSSVSALSFHKLIDQIPKDVFCFTLKPKRKLRFLSDIYFIKTKYFFGFENKEYLGFNVPMATPEKAIIDSFGIVPVSIFEEALENINLEKMISYLKRTKKSSIIKRVGYLLEKKGFDVTLLRKKINRRYIYLDPIARKSGVRNKIWGIIDNT